GTEGSGGKRLHSVCCRPGVLVACQCSCRVALALPEALGKWPTHRCQVVQQVVQCTNAVRSGLLAPTLPTDRVAKDASPIPAVFFLSHASTCEVLAGPDGRNRPRLLVEVGHLAGLLSRTCQ